MICSGGNKPGELKSIDTPENRKRITPVMLTCSADFAREVGRAGEFATVVLDHASGFSDLILAEIMGLDPTAPVTKYRVAGKGESWSVVDQRQYGQLAIQAKEHFRTLLNLPGNVVIVAQQRTFGGRDDGLDPELIRPTVGAALTPSLTGWLNPACDYVLQTFKRPKMKQVKRTVGTKEIITNERDKGVEYCLRTEPHEVFMTKFRVPRGLSLPDCIVNPSYEKIMAILRGEEVDGN